MSILIKNLKNEKTSITPIWLMRQAGRHLPEYLEIKKKYKNLLDMFLDTETIVKVTLQPVNRYNLDASIIFSDILIIPYLMGNSISFNEHKKGPQVNFNLIERANFKKADPIYNAIKIVKERNEKPLIGFSGGVWTTIYYCLFNTEIRKKMNNKIINENEKKINELIPLFTETIINHAINQVNSGVDIFQIFESWSGLLNEEQFNMWCLKPAQDIISALQEYKVYTIGFPREASLKNYIKYSNIKNLNCISLDTKFDLKNLTYLNQKICFQGNLDPQALLKGNEDLYKKVNDILLAFQNYPHIFNLGHGVLPETPTENVQQLVNQLREKEIN